jgi:hypothetical protein
LLAASGGFILLALSQASMCLREGSAQIRLPAGAAGATFAQGVRVPRRGLVLATVALAACLVAAAVHAAALPFGFLPSGHRGRSIVPSSGVVPAGRVRIRARNLGLETHQLMVVRTRVFAQDLRVRGDRAVARRPGAGVPSGAVAERMEEPSHNRPRVFTQSASSTVPRRGRCGWASG